MASLYLSRAHTHKENTPETVPVVWTAVSMRDARTSLPAGTVDNMINGTETSTNCSSESCTGGPTSRTAHTASNGALAHLSCNWHALILAGVVVVCFPHLFQCA